MFCSKGACVSFSQHKKVLQQSSVQRGSSSGTQVTPSDMNQHRRGAQAVPAPVVLASGFEHRHHSSCWASPSASWRQTTYSPSRIRCKRDLVRRTSTATQSGDASRLASDRKTGRRCQANGIESLRFALVPRSGQTVSAMSGGALSVFL